MNFWNLGKCAKFTTSELLRNRLWTVATLALVSVFSVAVGCGRRAGDSKARAAVAAADANEARSPPVVMPVDVGVAGDSHLSGLRQGMSPVGGKAADPEGTDAKSFPDATVGNDGARPESLRVEERERDPRSETVTIKVVTDSPKGAQVYWGPKDLGPTPLEILRPRSSGPLDLILRAPGYLTLHTRAFTDRDDRIAVHLIPETDAPRMLGYRAR